MNRRTLCEAWRHAAWNSHCMGDIIPGKRQMFLPLVQSRTKRCTVNCGFDLLKFEGFN